MTESTQELLLCLWCLFLLTALALFVRYEERGWGDVPPLALLLAFMGIVTTGVSFAVLLQPWSLASIAAGLLLLVSVGALLVGSFARWTRQLALGSSLAFVVALLAAVPTFF